jgi:putative transposase
LDDEEVTVHRGADHRDTAGEQEGGMTTADVCRRHGISSATLFKWKAKFGGMDVSDARKLKQLEDENNKLKRLLAEAMLDITMLKDLNSKKW